MSRGEDLFLAAVARGCRRDRSESVSVWADRHRILSSVSSAESGHWRTDRTPYLREPMDCLSADSPIQRVVMMTGAQVGKTETGNNWIGYIIESAPGPMLMIQPTVDMARRVSKQRIAPMIAATPILRERVRESREKDSGNTIFVKEFEGGILIMGGANSSAGLRSMPIRYLFGDEIDEWPGDVGGQGDSLAIAEKRTSTFPRRKILLTSSPTIKGLSRIEREFLRSDQRRFFLPCPECGHFDYLTWSGFDWFNSSSGAHHRIEFEKERPESARMVCSGCGARIEERHKTNLLAAGEWRPTNLDGRPAGFHLSSLYSPLGWKSWGECVSEFLEAKDDRFKLKAWVNTVLGETFEEHAGGVEPHALLRRVEVYDAEVPHGVGVLVGSADVQANRVECLIKGYGAGEESWLIARTVVFGDPERASVWFDVDKFFSQAWEHSSGRKLFVTCVAIDSGGHHSEIVYKFCGARTSRRFFAVRGGSMRGAEVVGKPTRNNRYGVPLFTLCTDTAKDIIFSRISIGSRGPGYLHFPDNGVDLEYFEQLTSEVPQRRWYKHKGALRDWIPIRDRNEALDLEVYCLAALYILGDNYVRRLGEAAAALSAPVAGQKTTPPEPDLKGLEAMPPRRTRRPGRWMDLGRRR